MDHHPSSPPSPDLIQPPGHPQDPHNAVNAAPEPDPLSSTANHDRGEGAQQSLPMKNFRALVFKFIKPLTPADESLIEQRLRDFFPAIHHVPDHPPYSAMIKRALEELNTGGGGSSEEAISEFIKDEYNSLPWAHSTILAHHLQKLSERGDIVMRCDQAYILRSVIINSSPSHSPIQSPSSSLSPNCSPCSSPSSSPSPSSSSSSSSSPSPRRRLLKRKRKRSQIQQRGRGRPSKHIQGRGWGRSRKKDEIDKEFHLEDEKFKWKRERTCNEKRGRGGSRKTIQGRGRGRPRKNDETPEGYQLREEQTDVAEEHQGIKADNQPVELDDVIEDHNQVADMKGDETNKNNEVQGPKCQVVLEQRKAEVQNLTIQSEPQGRGAVEETEKHQKPEKIISEVLNQGRGWGRPRKKDEIDEDIHLEDENFKRKRKRKRMRIEKRGRGGSRKMIQGRQRGRPRKYDETPEGYLLREEKTDVAEEHQVIKEDNQPVELDDVTEDHNQVADMKVDETNKNNEVQGQKCQVVLEQRKAEEVQNLTIQSEPQGRGAVEEREKHQKPEKIISEVLYQGRGRGRPRKKDEINEDIHLEDENFKRKRKRKRMRIEKRGRGGSRKMIQGRQRGRPRKYDETPEGYLLREEKTDVAEEHQVIKEDNQRVELDDVIEDHNQVADMKVDETNKNNVVQGQKCQVVLEQRKAEEVQNLTIQSEPQGRGAVEEREKHQKPEKIISEVLNQGRGRGRPRKKDEINEDIHLEDENFKRKRKRMRIEKRGRGGSRKTIQGRRRGRPRKYHETPEGYLLREEQTDVAEEHQVIKEGNQPVELKGVIEDHNQVADMEVDETNKNNEVQGQKCEVVLEQSKAEEEQNLTIRSEPQGRGAVDEWEKHQKQEKVLSEVLNQPEEHQNDGLQETELAEEQIEVNTDQNRSSEQEDRVIVGQDQGEGLHSYTDHQLDVLMIRSVAQADGLSEEHWHQKRKGERIEPSQAEEWNIIEVQYESTEQHMEVTEEKIHPCVQRRVVLLQDQQRKLEYEVSEGQCLEEEQQNEIAQEEVKLQCAVTEGQYQEEEKQTEVIQVEDLLEKEVVEGKHQEETLKNEVVQEEVQLEIKVIGEQQDVRMIISEAREDGSVEDLNQQSKWEKRGSLEQNQLEDQENDALQEQILPQKQLMDVIEEKVQLCEQQEKEFLEKDQLQKQNVEGAEELHQREELGVEVFQEEIQLEELGVEVFQEEIQLEEEVMEKQRDLLMIKGEAVDDGAIEKTTGQQKQVKGAGVEVEQKELDVQLDDVIGDQVQPQDRCMEGAREKIQSCEQEEIAELDHLAKREAEGLHQQEEQQNEEILADEVVEEQQALGVIESEAEGGDDEGWNWRREHGKRGSLDQNQSEEQESDALQEQILPKKQLVDMFEEKVQLCEQQENDLEQDQLQKQKVEVAEELHQQEEPRIEMFQEDIELEVEVFEEQSDLVMIRGEDVEVDAVENSTGQQKQVKGAGVEQKELEGGLDNVIGERVQPQEKCIKEVREKIQLCEQEEIAEQDHLAKREAEGLHQLEEQQNEEILADEVVEEQQDVGTIKTEAEKDVSAEEWSGQHEEKKGERAEVNQLKEHENAVSGEQNQERDQWTEGNKEKFQACELHPRIIMELKDRKELEVEIVDREEHQEEELKVEVFEKENQLQKYNVESSESLQLCDVRSKDLMALPCKSFWSLMEEEKDEFLNNFRDQEMKSLCQDEEISYSSSKWANKLPELPLLESSPNSGHMKEISSLCNQLVQARLQDEPLHPQFPISKLEPATTASALEVLPCKHMLRDHCDDGRSTELKICAPCVEELPPSHHQNQGEQRRSVREGLRPRNRNVEAVATSANQHGQRQLVRRSPRHLKTNLEAAATTEGLDHSEKRLKCPGIGRSTKLNIAATDRILRSGRTRKLDPET